MKKPAKEKPTIQKKKKEKELLRVAHCCAKKIQVSESECVCVDCKIEWMNMNPATLRVYQQQQKATTSVHRLLYKPNNPPTTDWLTEVHSLFFFMNGSRAAGLAASTAIFGRWWLRGANVNEAKHRAVMGVSPDRGICTYIQS